MLSPHRPSPHSLEAEHDAGRQRARNWTTPAQAQISPASQSASVEQPYVHSQCPNGFFKQAPYGRSTQSALVHTSELYSQGGPTLAGVGATHVTGWVRCTNPSAHRTNPLSIAVPACRMGSGSAHALGSQS